ncbi:UNVERIFIED_CONTAM: hypothetical protein Scaly_0693100 [Sesamum calycinum]|uniref:RNase H type-1 domain-containing protein n=1 Tax=Sesamum calycinum TaxID=2727403 RepID=A0AAW2R6M3_9LAMI
MSNPDNLLSSVLRARYFPNRQVLIATSGRNPLYAWKSILAAQQVVRGGFCWQIGSGHEVRVWEDPWFPRPFSFRILSPLCGNALNMRVSDLIDPNTKELNSSLVQSLFWPEEVASILVVPLSAIGGDFFVWHHTANEVGVGVVARDSAGPCLWWKFVRKKGSLEPELVEAFEARDAVLLARSLGWRRIILEGDCANLYTRLSSSQLDCSALGLAKKIAHCLARNVGSSVIEGPCFPSVLSAMLLTDSDQ